MYRGNSYGVDDFKPFHRGRGGYSRGYSFRQHRRNKGRGRDRSWSGGGEGEGGSGGRGGGGGGGEGRGRGGRKGRAPHPPGLKGKEIGLWYASRGRKRRQEEERDPKNLPQLSMDVNTRRSLGHVLNTLDGGEKDIKQEPNSSSSSDQTQLSQTLNTMADSSFKRAYLDNIQANKKRELDIDNTAGISVNIKRDKDLDSSLYAELEEKMNSDRYREMQKVRERLPAYKMRDEIVDTIIQNQVVVISGETGCGKTTQVAQLILDDMIRAGCGSICRIVCTQPRRISAISIAHRVADERAESLGVSSGFQIRLEKHLPRESGSILYCTTGIVLQWLQTDSLLSRVSHLVLDEIHERDTISDFMLCIMKDVLPKRPDLKLILMSATLNADMFSKYYGNCPMLHIPGFTFPVTEYYLEDVVEQLNYRFSEGRQPGGRRIRNRRQQEAEYQDWIEPYLRNLEGDGRYSLQTLGELYNFNCEELDLELIYQLIVSISSKPAGAILVFLPGWSDISSLHRTIQFGRHFNPSNSIIIPLHSMMPTTNQRTVFDRPRPGIRKIVLATNIAETSITIDDVVYVIDCGKIKMTNYDKAANLATLDVQWVSIANARQRRGRAGRVQKGICYHLYTKAREMLLDDYPLPEIQRTPLEEVILHIKILKLGMVKRLLAKIMEPPEVEVIDGSLKTLRAINAIDDEENLTPLGFHLAQLPIDPLTGRMLIMGALFSCLGPILTIASMLSFKDAFVIPLGQEKVVDAIRKRMSRGEMSDHLLHSYVYDGWVEACADRRDREYIRDHFLSSAILNQIKSMRDQFLGHLHEHKFVGTLNTNAKEINRNSANISVVKAVITAGLYPNVVKLTYRKTKKKIPPRMCTRYDKKISIHPKSVNCDQRDFQSCWLVFREKLKSSMVYIFDCTNVANYPILLFGQKLNYDKDLGIIDVDGFCKVACTSDVARVVQNLRNELDTLLKYKISHPGVCDWNENTKEGKLLNTIVDLITSEDVSASAQHDMYYDDFAEDDDQGNNF